MIGIVNPVLIESKGGRKNECYICPHLRGGDG